MTYIRLLWVFFRIGILGELAYRVNFLVQFFQSLLGLGTALAGLAVIFSHTQDLGGWRPDELVALVGVYLLVGGAINLVIQPSMERLIESVREGTLDFTLTKPEDAQLLVSVQAVQIWKLTDVVLGFGVLVVALIWLGPPWEHGKPPRLVWHCWPEVLSSTASGSSLPRVRSGLCGWKISW